MWGRKINIINEKGRSDIVSKKREASVEAVVTSPIGIAIILKDLGKLASLGCHYAIENPETPKDVLLYIKNSEQLLDTVHGLIEILLDNVDEEVMDKMMNTAMDDIKDSLSKDEFNDLMAESQLNRASTDVIEDNMINIIRGLDDE